MRDMVKMVLVLTILSSFSGGILAAVRDVTRDKIEYQQLKFEKEPAIRKILEGCVNNPVSDRFRVDVSATDTPIFPGRFDDRDTVVVFESFGKGFSGEIGLMVGVDPATDKITGVAVTTHSETPGIGSKAKEDGTFGKQFSGRPVTAEFRVKADGGEIDAITGATITSRGVCLAVTKAGETYKTLKPEINEKLTQGNK